MRVAIMGSGGVGGYYGGMLARAGEDVAFIARGAHLDAMCANGLMVKTAHVGEFTIPVKATDDPNEIGPVDLVLFCVKTYDTDTVAGLIRPLIGPERGQRKSRFHISLQIFLALGRKCTSTS
ncbi:2-dehydropantoate 2-reductase N-terminal domain-containing protein [Chroococcidiopsis sp. CCMEE 29]|uniref:ketopantoate reductase family protein n=1 Tax=Chroococcidiopsis sp. CCMEE 29 TaxID=155894 RepID=UPI0020216A03|nr:2-dehydropantoate 2-reductase N-terminal domain-containing protein [Chroococcidiopsis sp. CCMEE 29]